VKTSIKWLAALGFVLLAAAVLLRTYAQFRNDPPQDQDEEEEQEAIKIPSRVSVTNGQMSISLDAATQQRMGIDVAPAQDPELSAPGISCGGGAGNGDASQ
jgi:hypothetical protein